LKYFSMLAPDSAGQDFLASWLLGSEAPNPAHAHHAAAKSPEPNVSTSAPRFFSSQEYWRTEILTELSVPTDD
jgi:hypothetical protein